jgi:hypothetical protein
MLYPGAPASRPVLSECSDFPLLNFERTVMFRLITGASRPSKTKSLALGVFSLVRAAQRFALQVPVVAHATAQDIAEAWRESGATRTKNA